MRDDLCKCGHTADQHYENHGYTLACGQVCYCLQYVSDGDR